jgi:hypothetical protein
MSGLSVSFTFPISPALGNAAAQAIAGGDTGPLDELGPNNPNCFQTSSRNNWIEYRTHLLVADFAPPGLAYLSKCFTGRTHPVGGFFANALHDQELCLAIEGIRHLLSSLRLDIARTARALEGIYVEDSDFTLLDTSPSSIADAQERFDACRTANEGEDIPTIVAFLQGHQVVLEAALKATMSSLYVGYIY